MGPIEFQDALLPPTRGRVIAAAGPARRSLDGQADAACLMRSATAWGWDT